jgi:hypothetical protein
MRRETSTSLPKTLSALELADRNQLSSWFEVEFGHLPHPKASLAWMRQNLAWSIQVKAGGVTAKLLRQQLIKRLSRQLTGKTKGKVPYRSGTRLIREWQGRIYEVTVEEDGFTWNGNTYPNLSQIAKAITGTKWSGPRFFGLKAATHDPD